MGQSFAKLFNFRKEETKILMVGLDAAGKTTILYKLKLGEVINTIPTIGFSVETVQCKDLNIFNWDVGGEDKIRPLWRHYYQMGINAIIFVIDSNDRERMPEAREELQKILREDELEDAILLVFANKQDLPSAMSISEITDKLRLNSLRERKWFVQLACGTTGDGLYDGLSWIASTLKQAQNNKTNAFNATNNLNSTAIADTAPTTEEISTKEL